MAVAFWGMGNEDLTLKGVAGRVPPDIARKLDVFGLRLRELKATDQKGVSAALALLIEMAEYEGWLDSPEAFAVDLLKARANAIEKTKPGKK